MIIIVLPLHPVSSADYAAMSTVFEFNECQKTECTDITISNDFLYEGDESFYVTLERTRDLDERITLNLAKGEVEIVDDDIHSESVDLYCSTPTILVLFSPLDIVVRLNKTKQVVRENVGNVYVCAVMYSHINSNLSSIEFPFALRVSFNGPKDSASMKLNLHTKDPH